MRAGWGSKAQQRQADKVENSLSRLDRVGRMTPVPVANFAVTATQMTRGAQISFLVMSLEGIDSFVLMRNFSRDPGSAKAIHTWPAVSFLETPQRFPVQLHFADADESTSGRVAYYWLKAVPASKKTVSNVFLSGAQKFDASGVPTADKLMGDYGVTQSYTPTTQPISATTGGSPNHATISVGSFIHQYPFGPVTYNSGPITPLLDATVYYVYCDDPTYKGGAQTYIASTLNPDITAGKYRLYLGKVTTPAFGGGGTSGGGGGGGACFSGNTCVQVERRGRIPIEKIVPGDRVYSRLGWRRVAALLVHDFEGELREMGSGELVTPQHRMWIDGDWKPASVIFTIGLIFKGKVYNLALESKGKTDLGHCYTLANGFIAHNTFK